MWSTNASGVARAYRARLSALVDGDTWLRKLIGWNGEEYWELNSTFFSNGWELQPKLPFKSLDSKTRIESKELDFHIT
jgi:hypothetical protein